MRLLAFSDIHGEEAALAALSSIAPSYSHVFICGDISRTAVFAESVLRSFSNAFIIPGNWDNKIVNDILSKSPQWIHAKRIELEDGLNAVGFGYSPPTPFGTYGEMKEEEIYLQMSKLPIDENTLLLLHCPPKGHFDTGFLGRSIGSESILRIIEEKKPIAAFFGHAHENEGMGMLGHTTLIKLPPANSMRACSVDIRHKNITVEFMAL